MSNLIVKNLNFGNEARNKVFEGITKLTTAVSSTLGASGKCVMLEDATGKPIITKDGVTVANSVILLDPVENMGATLLKEAARKTVQEAGDGTTTATVLAHSILEEAYKVANKTNSRELKNGINNAVGKVVKFLKKHNEVTKVIYSTEHDKIISGRANKYLKGGNGPMVGIELKGGIEAGQRFIESLKMFYHVANIGDARSLAIHPASTTHSQLNEKELAASGVTQSYVRLCIGLEHIDDIIDDLDQALNKSSKGNLKAVS